MATVKSFSYSDQNSAVASWVKEQKSLSQSLEIAIKMAIAQYGICDLAEKRDQLFAQGTGVQAPVIKQSVPLNDADRPQYEAKQEPAEANDISAEKEAAEKEASKNMPAHQSHDDPSASTAQTHEPENVNNDDSDLDLSFLDLKQ